MTTRLADCHICGAEGVLTVFAVVRWKSGEPEYTVGPRCIDRLACRERVEAKDETWDVAEPEREGATR